MRVTKVEIRLDKLTAILGGAAALVVGLMGGWSPAMTILLVFIVLDFVLGTVRSAVQGRLSSATSLKKTGVKLVLLWALVTFASQLDCSLGTSTVVRDALIIAFTVAQGTSILENSIPIAEAVGWDIPPFLKEALEQLQGEKANRPPQGGEPC